MEVAAGEDHSGDGTTLLAAYQGGINPLFAWHPGSSSWGPALGSELRVDLQEVGVPIFVEDFEGVRAEDLATRLHHGPESGTVARVYGYHPGEPTDAALLVDPWSSEHTCNEVLVALPLAEPGIQQGEVATVRFDLFRRGDRFEFSVGLSGQEIVRDAVGAMVSPESVGDLTSEIRFSEQVLVRDGDAYEPTGMGVPMESWFEVFLVVDYAAQRTRGYVRTLGGDYEPIGFGSGESGWRFRDGGDPLEPLRTVMIHASDLCAGQVDQPDLFLVDNIQVFFGGEYLFDTIERGPQEAAIGFADTHRIFLGEPQEARLELDPPGVPISLTYDGSPDPPVDAGTYQLFAEVDHFYYAGSAEGTLTIEPAPVAITLGGLDRVYDGASQAVSPSTDPHGVDLRILYDGDPAAPVDPGVYHVTARPESPNFEGLAEAEMRITRVTVQPTHIYLEYTAGSAELIVTTVPEDVDWEIAGAPPWVALSHSTGTGSASITAQVGANPDPQVRSAEITVAGDTVVIEQAPRPLRSVFDDSPDVIDYGDGYRMTGLGFVQDWYFPYVYLYRLGTWVYVFGEDETGFYLWDFHYEHWAFTGRDWYPFLWILSGPHANEYWNLSEELP